MRMAIIESESSIVVAVYCGGSARRRCGCPTGDVLIVVLGGVTRVYPFRVDIHRFRQVYRWNSI
jgi:hypothetical protein